MRIVLSLLILFLCCYWVKPVAQAHPTSKQTSAPVKKKGKKLNLRHYFPLAVGNWWSYSSGGGAFGFGGKPKPYKMIIRSKTKKGYRNNRRRTYIHDSYGLRRGKRYILKHPIVKGHKWDAQWSPKAGLLPTFSRGTYRIQNPNATVRIAKKVYKHCVVVAFDMRASEIWSTYCKHVGLVKEVSKSRTRVYWTRVLLSYQVRNK